MVCCFLKLEKRREKKKISLSTDELFSLLSFLVSCCCWRSVNLWTLSISNPLVLLASPRDQPNRQQTGRPESEGRVLGQVGRESLELSGVALEDPLVDGGKVISDHATNHLETKMKRRKKHLGTLLFDEQKKNWTHFHSCSSYFVHNFSS